MSKRLILTGTSLCAAMIVSDVQADDLHYNNMLIGERAMGLGGAYAAVSDDPSGLYYNPAGIVYAGGSNLSASVNAFHTTNTTYDNVIGAGQWSRSSSSLLPNFFGVIQPVGGGYVGFSYAVPDSQEEDQDQVFRNFGRIDEYVININNTDTTYKIGPSYARAVTDNFSIGTTLYLHSRTIDATTNQWIRVNDGSYEWTNSYYESEEWGVNPVLGLMWSPFDKVSVGLSMRQTFIMQSDTQRQLTCATDIQQQYTPTQCLPDPTYNNPRDPSIDERTLKRELPMSATLGVAYFPSSHLLLSGDFSYYDESDDFTLDREATWNAALGGEYYFNSQLALRTGIYTNRANTPELRENRLGQREHINLTGLSVSLSRFTRNSSLTGGVNYTVGEGEAQVFEGVSEIQNARTQTTTFFLATSYSY